MSRRAFTEAVARELVATVVRGMMRDVATVCSGKAGYETPQLAWQVAQRGSRRRRSRKAASTYRWPCCGLFHVGQLPKDAF